MTKHSTSSWSVTKYPLSNPQHPLWDFGRYVVLMGAATIILYVNANDFDITEARSLTALAGSMGVLAGAERYIRSLAKRTNDDEVASDG